MKIYKGLALVVAACAGLLAGCNGQEEFPLNSPVLGVFGQGSDFDPEVACSPRRVGALVDYGTVKNVRYECDGFFGNSGEEGLPRETSANLFVCPLSAESVTFYIGGNTNRIELGSAYFRAAAKANPAGECAYDEDTEEFTTGVYDADGIYLFSLADLVDSPARVDVGDASDTPEEVRARNASAILAGLDATSGDDLIVIEDVAHLTLVADPVFTIPAGFMEQDFADFVSATGTAQDYLDEVELRGGTVSASGLPVAEQEAIDSISLANKRSSAGLYRYALSSSDLSTLAIADPDFFDSDFVVVGDSLPILMQRNALDPEGGVDGTLDQVLLGTYATDFAPLALVTRRGQVTLGASFDVRDFGDDEEFASACDEEIPEWTALSVAGVFEEDGTFNWNLEHLHEGGAVDHTGRMFGDYAFHGKEGTISGVSDFDVIYPSLPDSAYAFNSVTDETRLNGTLCGEAITDQPVNSFLRVGTVTPTLDAEVMTELAGTVAEYTLEYWARNDEDDEEPDQVVVATLPITIHEDGAIFTDLYLNDGSDGSDGNPGYTESGPIPAHEYEVGLVSSTFRSDVTPEDASLAVANIAIFNFAPLADQAVLPMYGSHFRARFVPKAAAECDNALSAPADGYAFLDVDEDLQPDPAVWLDPYNTVEILRTWTLYDEDNPATAAEAQLRWQNLRTRAYGYVTAVRTDCP